MAKTRSSGKTGKNSGKSPAAEPAKTAKRTSARTSAKTPAKTSAKVAAKTPAAKAATASPKEKAHRPAPEQAAAMAPGDATIPSLDSVLEESVLEESVLEESVLEERPAQGLAADGAKAPENDGQGKANDVLENAAANAVKDAAPEKAMDAAMEAVMGADKDADMEAGPATRASGDDQPPEPVAAAAASSAGEPEDTPPVPEPPTPNSTEQRAQTAAPHTEKHMKEPSIGIAREGWPAIFITGLGAVVFAMMGCTVMATIFFVLCWFSLGFFRDPERVVPDEKDIAVSPADGRIVKIERREAPLDGGSCQCVSIFMNVFNVHVNRAPVDGTLEKIAYHPGKFLNASLDKASTDNERCAYQMRDGDGKAWTFVQIAGLVARRIVCRADRGDELARGARFGLIRFGSRVDLYLPDGYIPAVSVGDTVLAGQTVIARRMEPEQ